MTPAYVAVERFYDLYFGRDKIAYWMGAKGELLTRKRMQELVDAYPDYFKKYDDDRLEELMRWSEGKIGYDCSGLVCACYGIAGYSSWTLREMMVRTTSVKECKAAGDIVDLSHRFFKGAELFQSLFHGELERRNAAFDKQRKRP